MKIQSVFAESAGNYWRARTFYNNKTIRIEGYPRSVHIQYVKKFGWWELTVLDENGNPVGISDWEMYGHRVIDTLSTIRRRAILDYNMEIA